MATTLGSSSTGPPKTMGTGGVGNDIMAQPSSTALPGGPQVAGN